MSSILIEEMKREGMLIDIVTHSMFYRADEKDLIKTIVPYYTDLPTQVRQFLKSITKNSRAIAMG